MARAEAETGLHAFGDPWFVAPLRRLLAAIEAEAGLTGEDDPPVQRIVQSLVDRLRLQDYLARHPGVLREKVEVAAAILGLPRTGSTMLQRLLGSSPQLTSGYWWEVTFPLPLPGEAEGDPTPRQDAARAMVAAFYAAWPDFDSIHPMDAMAHDEDVMLLDKTFLSSTYDSILHIPGYGEWMEAADHRAAYRELRVWLQVLQYQSPARRGRRWILKSPHHLLGGLDGFLAEFPEARAIMTHRAIEEVIPSYCSLCASMTAAHSRNFVPANSGAYWTGRFSRALRRLIDRRAGPEGGRFIDVRYDALQADPLAVAEMIFGRLGLAFGAADRAAMAAWLAENGREKRPPHQYDAAAYGLSADGMRRDFAFYSAAFLEGAA